MISLSISILVFRSFLSFLWRECVVFEILYGDELHHDVVCGDCLKWKCFHGETDGKGL